MSFVIGLLSLIVVLGVFKPQPRYLVPVGGMVVGNSMTAAAVALNRLGDEVWAHARALEATLALGALRRMGFQSTQAERLVDAVLARDAVPADPGDFIRAALRATS